MGHEGPSTIRQLRRLSLPLLQVRTDNARVKDHNGDFDLSESAKEFLPIKRHNSLLSSLSRVRSISRSFIKCIEAQHARKRNSVRRCKLDESIFDFDLGLSSNGSISSSASEISSSKNRQSQETSEDHFYLEKTLQVLTGEPAPELPSSSLLCDSRTLCESPQPVQQVHRFSNWRRSYSGAAPSRRLSLCN